MMPPAVPATDPTAAPAQKKLPAFSTVKSAAWRRRVKAALDSTKVALEQGKKNIERYNAEYLESRTGDDQVCVPTDFYYIEQKKSQLFAREPDVFLQSLQPGQEDGAIVGAAALNAKLGPQGVNVLPTVHEIIFDTICATGFGAVKIGFEAVKDGTVDIQIGEEPDLGALPVGTHQLTAPTTPDQLGPALGLGPLPMKPIMAKAPNIIASRYFIERVAPGDLIVPADFSGSDFDKAAFLGCRFLEDLPDENESGSDIDREERRLTPLSSDAKAAQRKQRVGYEVYYRASLFDADEKHPECVRCFTYYDDDPETTPIQPKQSPYQRLAPRPMPQPGQPPTPPTQKYEGMVGFPIAPLTIRYVSDTWRPKSDCSMARATADELSKGRTQMVQFRDRNMPQTGFDVTAVDAATLAKIERNILGAWVGFNRPGQDATWPIQKGQMGRESSVFNDVIQGDLERIWGLGANQLGAQNDTARTATELQLVQSASQGRLESERLKVLSWYANKVVAKFFALMQLFADEEEYIELVGSDAQRLKAIPPEVAAQVQQNPQAMALVPWTKANIPGRYGVKIKPDSQLHIDVAQQREQLLKVFNFLANEPTANRTELTREVLKTFHMDPTKTTQAPPQKMPEPPKLTLAIKMEDFVMPQGPVTVEIAQQLGLKISPEAILASQQFLLQAEQLQAAQDAEAANETEHGGASAEAKKINKHPTEATGGMQGSGAQAPVAPGGQLM